MKKLALAFVCLASAAFFASCQPEVTNPEPSIAIKTGENYVYDGQTIDLYQDYLFGVRVASNSQTMKELSSFKILTEIEDMEGNQVGYHDTTFAISGTEYEYQETINFELTTRDEQVGKAKYTFTVTDINGKVNNLTVNLNLNLAEEALEVGDFDWFRLGNTQDGLEEFGLYWHQNAKSPFAQIKPVEGAILYKFSDSSVWDQVVLPSQKTAVFADGATTASMYNNVDVNQNGVYDDVIGTFYNGEYHLLHVTSCVIGAQQAAGRPIHIYGQHK